MDLFAYDGYARYSRLMMGHVGFPPVMSVGL